MLHLRICLMHILEKMQLATGKSLKNTNMKKICHTKNWQYYTIIPQLK